MATGGPTLSLLSHDRASSPCPLPRLTACSMGSMEIVPLPVELAALGGTEAGRLRTKEVACLIATLDRRPAGSTDKGSG